MFEDLVGPTALAELKSAAAKPTTNRLTSLPSTKYNVTDLFPPASLQCKNQISEESQQSDLA